jgi:hypothetical protein
MREVLSSGKYNVPIQDKTITLIYGLDFLTLQSINFVCMAENAVEIAKVRFFFNF